MPYSEQVPRREREYPPTPYAPHSEATRAYRDAYDLGRKHLGSISSASLLRYHDGLEPGSPSQRGYEDGVRAAWMRLMKLEEFGRQQARRVLAEAIEERRRSPHQEPPY